VRPLGATLLLSLVALGCNVVLGLDDLVADRATGGGAAGGNGAGGDATGAAGPTGGCSAVCGTAGCGDCPTTPAIPVADAGYSIDAMEVSTLQYAAWLATNPSTAGQAYPCEGNDSYELGVMSDDAVLASVNAGFGDMPPAECAGFMARQVGPDLDKAVVCVDWCDPFAYCIWAGGRLCGEIGGGLLDVSDENKLASNDPARSEWFRACSVNGTQTYPYPGPYDDSLCNDDGSGVDAADDHAGCGVGELINLSGNVLEWENTCTTKNTPNALFDNCVRRGGAFFSPPTDLGCALPTEKGNDQTTGTLPGTPSGNTGFRCCH
jgi:formylglycine-generating enzyme required for sulfatase activity